MKYAEMILSATEPKQYGNYSVDLDGCIRTCIYKGITVCVINEATKTFISSNGGSNDRHVTRAMRTFQRILPDYGYIGEHEK
jgi:hypothetical protein